MGEIKSFGAGRRLVPEALEAQGMGRMIVVDETGDTRIMWNPRDADEVQAARNQFDELVGEKRFVAHRVARDGDPAEEIAEFDPDAEKLILTPPMAGGSAPPWTSDPDDEDVAEAERAAIAKATEMLVGEAVDHFKSGPEAEVLRRLLGARAHERLMERVEALRDVDVDALRAESREEAREEVRG